MSETGQDNGEESFYTEERWSNWMERVREEDIDPESEEGARLFFNLQDDVTIAYVKIVEAYDDGELDTEEALEEIMEIREIVTQDAGLDDENKEMMVEGVRTSLMGVMGSCEEYIANGTENAQEGDVEDYVIEAAKAEEQDEMDRALGLISIAGAKIIDGDDFDIEELEGEFEYGFVSEWVNGLDSLQDAVSEPEMIEEDD